MSIRSRIAGTFFSVIIACSAAANTITPQIGGGISQGGIGDGGDTPPPAQPITYYVSTSGSDSNSGLTQAAPWQTVGHVNAQTFKLNATILFNGGQTFGGGTTGLVFTPSVTPGRITVGSYGTGQPTISTGNSAECLTATNIPSVTITNIICAGGGNTTNTTAGISIVNSQAGNTKLAGPSISGVTVSGYGASALEVKGTNGTSGFNGSVVQNFTCHDVTGNFITSLNGTACVFFYSTTGYGSGTTAPSHTNITLNGIIGFNITGTAGGSLWSGSGVVVAESANVIGKNILIHDFGANANFTSGPCGVWAYDATNVHYLQLEVYHGLGSGTGAGCGVDFDGGVTNSLAEQFWSHDNNGPGALLYAYNDGTITSSSNNTMRDFIVQNNVRNDNVTGAAELQIDAGANATNTNPQAYNFTCYHPYGACLGQGGAGTIAGSKALVANHVFYGTSFSLTQVNSPGTLQLQGGDYYGATFFFWGGVQYTTYASFVSGAGVETVNGGHTFNPLIYVPGGGFGTGGYAPSQMMAYNPQSGSPVVGAGINLQTQFGINPGTQDFFGNAITAATLPIGAGAADFGTFTASCTQASTFLALTTGFNKLDNVNYNSWICGTETDGDLSKMDVAYLLAAPNHAAMLLDVSGNGHNLTEHGTVTFTARTGIASDGTTGYEDTGWNVNNGPNYTQNSITDAGYDLTGCGAIICGSLVQNSNVIWGVQNTAGTSETTLVPNNTNGASPGYYTDANDETGVSATVPANPSKGFWSGQRTSSSALAAWYNGAKIKNVTVNSVALPNANMFLLAQSNFGGAGITGGWLPDTISLAFVGGGGISVFNTSLRANSFMQAYGINVY